MPELPDLELFSGNLNARLRGKKVLGVEVGRKGHVRASAAQLNEALRGKSLRDAVRAGKETHLEFSGGTVLGVHLMLAGGFAVEPSGTPIKHEVLALEFSGKLRWAVYDPRGLASVTLNPEPSKAPDALEIDAAWLREHFAARPRLLAKDFLIDQTLLRGIGNAYADEILWKAKISPKSLVGKIPAARVAALARAIKTVLNGAMKTLKKLRPEALSGEDRSFLAVHNAAREQSPGGRPIQVETIGGKKTYFTDEQVLYA